MTTIPIEPFSFGPRGEATKFEIRGFSGTPENGASFDTHVWNDDETVELGQTVVRVTNEEFQGWLNNNPFYRLLATRAGYTPVVPSDADRKANLESFKIEVQAAIDAIGV